MATQNTPNRINRELETRVVTERPKQWMPPEALPEPDKEAGFTYRWVRVAMLNKADPSNISKSLREGWEPVKIEEQPQYTLLASREGHFKGNIEIGGLLLCKIPTEFMGQRSTYYSNMTNQQAEAVDNSFMRENDARMPLFKDRKSSVSFGNG
jgi:hypothetical protein